MENNPLKACCTATRPPTKEQQAAAVSEGRKGVSTDMVRLPGGLFLMGTEDGEGFQMDGEGPVRSVQLSPFYMDTAAITNEQFAGFILATGYKTDAEKFGWSFVFYGLLSQDQLDAHPQIVEQTPWWCAVPDACWNKPEGPDSHILNRHDHPVVHVSWNDATAYCAWTGKRLPTEAEWEYAARGGLVQKKFPWGDELTPAGEHRCNIWQGNFPDYNSLEDGYLGTAPARSFVPNDFGLYNMAGNVWEWCSDWFSPDFHINGPRIDPSGPLQGNAKVIRGGSFLCHHSYCNRYRVAARSSNTIDSTTSNMGFRCVMDC